MRFVKYSSSEQGQWTSDDTKLMTFEVPLNDDIDHDKSYLILNMGVSSASGFYNFMFGSPSFNVPYRSCALIQNSSLKSDVMSKPIEYNQDINLYMNNKKHYETGFSEQNALSYFQKSASFNYKSYHPPTPFLDKVNFDVTANPRVPPVYKTNNVIIPLSDLLASFGNSMISKKMGRKLTYQFELDKNHNLFTSVDQCSEPINKIACNDVTGAAGNEKLIYTTSTSYKSPYQTQFKVDDTIMIKYTTGGAARYSMDDVADIGLVNGQIVLTLTNDLWANGTAYTAVSVQRCEEAEDFVACANLPGGAKVLTTAEDYDEDTNPFYDGQQIKIVYGLQQGGAGAFNKYTEEIRNITKIEFNANKLVLTVDGANDLPASQLVRITTPRVSNAKYSINKADLVLYQGNFNVEIPKVYLQLEQIPRNKNEGTLIDETYLLNNGTEYVYFIQGSATELVSYDPNLNNYRINLDNKPTTEQNIVLNSSLSEDIKLRLVGANCKNLLNSLNQDLNERKVIIEQTRNKSMLQITMKAGNGGNMLKNILYLFSSVKRNLDM